jgi:glycosyltransferase involved in cell wall biosynthesis
MKICYITNLRSIHSTRWIEPLIEQGHEVYILNFLADSAHIKGAVEVVDLTDITNIPKFRFLIWGLWIRWYLGKIKPDILHAHQVQASGWIGAMSNYHPYIVTAWGSDLLVDPDLSKFRAALTKFVLKKVDHLTVPSKIMVKKAIDLGYPENKIHLIPWGLEKNIFSSFPDDRIETREKLNIPIKTPVLFCPRRIVQICNIDIVVTSLMSMVENYPEIRLVLIKFRSDQKYLDFINQIIIKNRLERNIIWLPAQTSQYSMARLYRMADIVLSIPSSEGYGFSVYEAMACGTPTIISNLPIYEEEITDHIHSIKVSVRNEEETVQAISWLLEDKTLACRIALDANEVIKEKSISNRIKAVIELYHQASSKP